MSEFQPESDHPGPTHLSARIPDSVSQGFFATGVVVIGMPGELVLDFLQTLVHPNELVGRVVLPWHTVPSLVQAMQQNLENHEKRFGGEIELEHKSEFHQAPRDPEPEHSESPEATEGGMAAPGNDPQALRRPASEAKQFYEELRYGEDKLIGVYANGAMINHSEFEFKIDFICSLQPYPIICSRVFLSKPQFVRLLKSLQDHQEKRRGNEP